MTSQAHVADLKGNVLRRTICPQSFIAIAFIFSELRRARIPPPPPVPEDQKSPVLIGLRVRMTPVVIGIRLFKEYAQSVTKGDDRAGILLSKHLTFSLPVLVSLEAHR